LVGIPEEYRPFGISRHTWENNIKMDLRETGKEVFNWIHLVYDGDQWRALVNTVMSVRVS
jgi:hypothetical protein